MRRRELPKPTATRIFDIPAEVRRADRNERVRHGVRTYEEPFEVASVLRAYGVRVLSAMQPNANEALRELANHQDARVRTAVVEELLQHQDVSALQMISHLADSDDAPTVREAAQRSLQGLQVVAARIAADTQRSEVPLFETGEAYVPEAPVRDPPGDQPPESPPEPASTSS